MQFWPIFEFFFLLPSGGDNILLIFIAGSNRNGLQTKKCWFAFIGLIIETATKRPANEFDSISNDITRTYQIPGNIWMVYWSVIFNIHFVLQSLVIYSPICSMLSIFPFQYWGFTFHNVIKLCALSISDIHHTCL